MDRIVGKIRQNNISASVKQNNISIGEQKDVIYAKDHSKLHNLDYEHSGHTGFASTQDLNTSVSISVSDPVISPEDLNKLTSNLTAKLILDGKYYSLASRSGNVWNYTRTNSTTGDIEIVRVDTNSGAFDIIQKNPVQQNLNAHINDTSVHLQAGERISWNEKVSADVVEAEEKLILF